jgi:hypothetical protein
MTEQPSDRTADPSHVPLPRRIPRTRRPLSASDLLQPVTRRGRLVSAVQAGGLDPREGDEVEIVGVPAPWSRSSHSAPALLIRQMRRLD